MRLSWRQRLGGGFSLSTSVDLGKLIFALIGAISGYGAAASAEHRKQLALQQREAEAAEKARLARVRKEAEAAVARELALQRHEAREQRKRLVEADKVVAMLTAKAKVGKKAARTSKA